jgi:hypothetical protein
MDLYTGEKNQMKVSGRFLRASALSAAWIIGSTLVFSTVTDTNSAFAGSSKSQAEEDFDRLDGMGASGKKVNVIEWEGNLEIHVYPAGSLKSLALTIDRKTKDKPVMVIGYRFNDNPQKQLIRRAIIDGISLSDSFHTYRDTSAGEYDKIVITNNNLDKVLTTYKLEPKPTQLYPEGHPALASQDDKGSDDRKPAAISSASKSEADAKAQQAQEDHEALQDSGTIRPFMMEGALRSGGSPRSR